MSLHDTAEFAKKAGIVLSIGFGVFLLVFIMVKVGGFINSILNPPKISSPNQAYGKLPPLLFPKSIVHGQFTYSINTLNGTLPQDFPDRIIVYPIIISQPNLLNLDDAKNNVAALGFVDTSGATLHEIPLGGPNYEWRESTGFQRRIIYNIVSKNFTMTSNYLTSLDALNAQNLGDQKSAVSTVQDFLNTTNSFPTDIDLTLTQNPDPNNDYSTSPLLYSILNGQMTTTTSLSNAQVIRVDLYQKEVDYTLTAGTDQDLTHFQDFDMKLPILYPHPPYSTMNFLIASGPSEADVVSAVFNHQSVNLQPDKEATYPIKTAQQAFDALKSGKGYIAAYNGTDSQILIDKVYLAYYLGATQQDYLMPVIVFEGQNGFFAYVSAVKNTALQ
ncbi:MAG TPA: hypothetical protein VND99_03025 [Candidatus Acidoferrales bacterium]|nr:hypothetical protein [Candidatus Acidoferrales bacterium]